MRFHIAVLTFAAAPLAAHAADAPERYSAYVDDAYLDDAYVATRERGNYVFEEEPIGEQVVIRRRFVEEFEPAYHERRTYVLSPRHMRRSPDRSYRRHDRPLSRDYRTDEAAGDW